jgi:hypothetical protein
LAAAMARGVKLGKPENLSNRRTGSERGNAVKAAKAAARAADLAPAIRDLRAAGVETLAGLAKGLNDRGIPTARGGSWSAVQVQRVLARME